MTDFALTPDWLAARAAVSPTALALITDGREWAYGDLDAQVTVAAGWLVQSGVRQGDHVGVRLPNCLAYVVVIHALTRIGAVLVPLNTRLSDYEVALQLQQANCKVCIFLQEAGATVMVRGVSILPVTRDLSELPVTVPSAALPPVSAGLDRLQAIVFTSGTTGRPKGAMLTYSNHFHSAVASAFRLGVMPTDRWLACLPLYHVGGLAILLRACLYGTAVVLQDGFDPDRVDRSLAHDQVTLVSLVPTMLYRLLPQATAGRWPALRLILLGGAAASEQLLRDAAGTGLPVASTYGLTEAASQVATQEPAQAQRKLGSAGRPLLFTHLRIAADDGGDLPCGEVGEVCVAGPSVFAGYFRDDTATAAVLQDGELRTGDLGYLDDDGELWLVQRRSDLIVCGGENVYPAEVENVLATHPAVEAVCVVGLPDDEWGQRVAALVVANEPIAAAELAGFAREHLAGYKIPSLMRFAQVLPLTGSGKVSRPDVVTHLLAELERVP